MTRSPRMDFTKSKELQRKSHELIPGGAHTYAKGDDQFPEQAPAFIARGQGCHVWDVDGNDFIEYGMGLRAVTLGHGFPRVVNAAREQMSQGSNYTRPSPLEVECAEELLSVIPSAEQVKFTKDGSTANTAAVRLARAYTGRDMVAFCGDHPFFSYDDWFIGKTPMNAGIPAAVSDLSVTFRYNDIGSVREVFEQNPGRIACVVLEAARIDEPRDGFLHETRDLCHAQGALFVLDENITGFRWHLGGAQTVYEVEPDLSSFGKAVANGFALSALAGKREFMDLGGIRHEKDRVFLLSTTHGAENHALAAAIETIRTYKEEPVIEHLDRQGEQLSSRLRQVSESHGLADHVSPLGRPCNLVFSTTGPDGRPSQEFRTLLLHELIQRGVLAPSLVVSYAHGDEELDETIDAFDGALGVYARALDAGVDRFLAGRASKPVMRRLN